MLTMGISIKKNEIKYAVLECNSSDDYQIICINKLNFRSELKNEELMNIFESEFLELINRHHPAKIIYKLPLNMKKDQIPYMYFSLGVLNLLCFKEHIKPINRTSLWMTANNRKKFNLCNDYFKSKNIQIKESDKEVVLLAWYDVGI